MMSERVLPMFSSRSFIVSGLTFRSLIHFEFIFVYDVRKCSGFILLNPYWICFCDLISYFATFVIIGTHNGLPWASQVALK